MMVQFDARQLLMCDFVRYLGGVRAVIASMGLPSPVTSDASHICFTDGGNHGAQVQLRFQCLVGVDEFLEKSPSSDGTTGVSDAVQVFLWNVMVDNAVTPTECDILMSHIVKEVAASVGFECLLLFLSMKVALNFCLCRLQDPLGSRMLMWASLFAHASPRAYSVFGDSAWKIAHWYLTGALPKDGTVVRGSDVHELKRWDCTWRFALQVSSSVFVHNEFLRTIALT